VALCLCLFGDHSREPPLRTAVTYQAAVGLVFWCMANFVAGDALAGPLERVEFQSASQPHIPGEHIQGYLAKPEGAGPFPAVVGLHGCAGMHDTTKRKLADDLVVWGYVVLLPDSFGTRGIDHICTANLDNGLRRISDAYGALAFLAGQTFVDPQRVAVVGFSQGGWVSLSVADSDYLRNLFVLPNNLNFRAAVAFYPPCRVVAAHPGVPTLIFIGAVDDWTRAADCSDRIASWGNDGPAIELVVYPGAYHGFYYPHLQPGRTMFGHWLEYNGAAADKARLRMQQFLARHLN
jgi:dienelactone hydrolase